MDQADEREREVALRATFRAAAPCRAVREGLAFVALAKAARTLVTVADFGSHAPVAEEAGGWVTDLAGRPPDFAHGRELSANRGLVITDGCLHGRVLAALEQPGPTSW